MRYHIRTIMIAVVIVGLTTALAVREWQTRRQVAMLRSRIQNLEKQKSLERTYIEKLDRKFFKRLEERKILKVPYRDQGVVGDGTREGLYESNPWAPGEP
jgi:hypothetical protein